MASRAETTAASSGGDRRRRRGKAADTSSRPRRAKTSRQSAQRKAEMVRRIITAGGKSLAKSLALSAAILGPGFFLLAGGQVVVGVVWLFVGAFGMLLWTYRKPWRLNWIACFMPPMAALGCYVVQLAVLNRDLPPAVILIGIILLGLVIGVYRGRAHEVYVDERSVMAQRTIGYLVVWAVAYGVTQFLSMVGSQVLLIQGGVLTGAFTTAMLATVSLLLFVRLRETRAGMV